MNYKKHTHNRIDSHKHRFFLHNYSIFVRIRSTFNVVWLLQICSICARRYFSRTWLSTRICVSKFYWFSFGGKRWVTPHVLVWVHVCVCVLMRCQKWKCQLKYWQLSHWFDKFIKKMHKSRNGGCKWRVWCVYESVHFCIGSNFNIDDIRIWWWCGDSDGDDDATGGICLGLTNAHVPAVQTFQSTKQAFTRCRLRPINLAQWFDCVLEGNVWQIEMAYMYAKISIDWIHSI